MNYCPCFGEVECGWNFILCGSGSEQKNCILFWQEVENVSWKEVENISWKEVENISWKENFYLVWWTASAVKGKRLVGIATCCQGPQNLWYLPLTEIHPDIFENVFLQWVHNAHLKIDKISYSAQLIFLINFKDWVQVFVLCLPWIESSFFKIPLIELQSKVVLNDFRTTYTHSKITMSFPKLDLFYLAQMFFRLMFYG